jgi:cell division septum initiation protein DivIVA
MESDEVFNINDTYGIKIDLTEIRNFLDLIEEDLNGFLSHKKSKKKGIKARSKIVLLKNKLLPEMSKKILKTKQDYEGDYS